MFNSNMKEILVKRDPFTLTARYVDEEGEIRVLILNDPDPKINVLDNDIVVIINNIPVSLLKQPDLFMALLQSHPAFKEIRTSRDIADKLLDFFGFSFHRVFGDKITGTRIFEWLVESSISPPIPLAVSIYFSELEVQLTIYWDGEVNGMLSNNRLTEIIKSFDLNVSKADVFLRNFLEHYYSEGFRDFMTFIEKYYSDPTNTPLHTIIGNDGVIDQIGLRIPVAMFNDLSVFTNGREYFVMVSFVIDTLDFDNSSEWSGLRNILGKHTSFIIPVERKDLENVFGEAFFLRELSDKVSEIYSLCENIGDPDCFDEKVGELARDIEFPETSIVLRKVFEELGKALSITFKYVMGKDLESVSFRDMYLFDEKCFRLRYSSSCLRHYASVLGILYGLYRVLSVGVG